MKIGIFKNLLSRSKENTKEVKFKSTAKHKLYLATLEQGTKQSIKFTANKLGLEPSIEYFKDTFRVSDDKAKLMSECGLYLIK